MLFFPVRPIASDLNTTNSQSRNQHNIKLNHKRSILCNWAWTTHQIRAMVWLRVGFLLLSNSRLVVRVSRPRTADSNITTTNTQSLKPYTQHGLTNALSRVMKPFSNTYIALVHLVNTQLMSMKFGQPIHFGRLIAVLPGKTVPVGLFVGCHERIPIRKVDNPYSVAVLGQARYVCMCTLL